MVGASLDASIAGVSADFIEISADTPAVDGSVLVVYHGAFLRRSAICFSGVALIVYHRTVMVWAMNVKGTLR